MGLEPYRDYIATLFSGDPASDQKQSIGLELELLPLKTGNDMSPVTLPIKDESGNGVLDVLKKNTTGNSGLIFSPREDGTPQLESAEGGNVTFEPGGQIEYSSSECPTIEQAVSETVKYVNLISRSLRQEEIWLYHGGLNPWLTVDEVGLKMRKPRYLGMDQYFQSLGPYGQQMMRLTLSLQVNLDFGDPSTARERWFASNLLVPVMCAIFGNSPFAQNAVTGFKSYRSFIWQNMDRCRTGLPILGDLLSPLIHPVDQYLAFALDAYVIDLFHDAAQNGEREKLISFRQWIASGHPRLQPDMKAWKNHISLLFPEVRPKGFLEFRTIDGPSRTWWSVPVMLLSSILYDAAALRQILDLLSPFSADLADMLSKASRSGVSAFPEIAKKVFRIGLKSTYAQTSPSLSAHCERFYKSLTDRGRNPADELLEINNGQVFTVTQFLDYEQGSREILDPPSYTIFS